MKHYTSPVVMFNRYAVDVLAASNETDFVLEDEGIWE